MNPGAPSAAASPEAAIVPPTPAPDRCELTEKIAVLQTELTEARERLTVLSESLAEIEQNPFRRATGPLRRLAAALPPPVRRGLLGVARGVYWGLAPHRMPARLRWIRYEPVLRAAVDRLERRSAAAYQRLGPTRESAGRWPLPAKRRRMARRESCEPHHSRCFIKIFTRKSLY